MITRKYIVVGHVQGVGFRKTILKFVNNSFKYSWGHVKNLDDRSVEIVLKASYEDHRALETYILQSPDNSKVVNLDTKEIEEGSELVKFCIKA